jgi:hypothetical protein
MVRAVRRGMITQFRDNIQSSPFAAVIEATKTSHSHRPFFTATNAEYFQESFPGVAAVVPDVQLAVRLSTEAGASEIATLISSVPGEPSLAFYDATVSDDTRAVVVTAPLAEALGLVPVQQMGLEDASWVSDLTPLTLAVTRQADHETCQTAVTVAGIIPGEGKTAYGHVKLLDWLGDFKQGRPVSELGVPARPRKVAPSYDGYLAFCLRQPGYSGLDQHRLHLRGLTARPLDEGQQPEADRWRRLYGLLNPAVRQLPVYFLRPESAGREGSVRVDIDPLEVERITDADDVIVPWVIPQRLKLDNTPHVIIGLTVRCRWLRPYFRDALLCRSSGMADVLVNVFRGDGLADGDTSVTVRNRREEQAQLAVTSRPSHQRLIRSYLEPWLDRLVTWTDGQGVSLESRFGVTVPPGHVRSIITSSTIYRQMMVIDRALCAPPPLPLAVTSADHLSVLAGWNRGELSYDPLSAQMFPRAGVNQYPRARLYARGIDDVPILDEALRAAGYSTISSRSRVEEMQRHGDTLALLDAVLRMTLTMCGTVTCVFVFWDVTGRKQRDIALHRLIGMPAWGVVIMFFVRGLMVWGMSSLATAVLGTAAVRVLAGLGIPCQLSVTDVAEVMSLALVPCLVGVTLPALWCSLCVHPRDAIAAAGIS